MDLLEHLKNMLNTSEGCDFSIIFLDKDGGKVEKRAHRLILRRSPYFSAMLDLQGTEVKNGSVTIENMTKETFDLILHYLYTDKLPNDVTIQQALDIASAGDYLQLAKMKSLAVEQWKSLYVSLKDKKEAVSQLRSFAAAPLNLVLDKTWRRVADVFMVAICEAISDPATRFGFGTESSSSFIEFVVGLCGKFYPLFTATSVVCDWVIARESHLTEVQRNERKQMAAQLAEKILLEKLTLRALVNLSLANVFGGDYLLRKMQTAMEDGWPAVDQVTYCLKFRCSRLIELEFENCFVLFNFEVYTDGNVSWKFAFGSDNVRTKVKIKGNSKALEQGWEYDTLSGTTRINDYKPSEFITVSVTLEPPKGWSKLVQCSYVLDVV